MHSRPLSETRVIAAIALAPFLVGAVAACGGGGGSESAGDDTVSLMQQPEGAADPNLADFPQPKGRSLQEVAGLARPGPEVAPATSQFVSGDNRFAFGLIADGGEFVYGPMAVYIARTPEDAAEGPFVAPSDSLVTEPEFRSQQAALEGDAASSIYSTDLNLPKPGFYSVLVVTLLDDELFGATTQIEVAEDSPIPEVGEMAPSVETDTLEDSGGQIANIDTRQPPDDLHSVDFAEVRGQKPVALLFATPQLCESRVCGPVTDIALQLREEYGDQVEFIHQEVYVENDPSKGLRAPLEAFNLPTEPWLFTFDEDGRVAARLEGSFGLAEFEKAVKAAL
jgi:hypothetical protein